MAQMRRSQRTLVKDGKGREQLILPLISGYSTNWNTLLVTTALNVVRPKVLR